MYKKLVPCIHFPTTTVLLDDEATFLEGVCFQLGHKTLLSPFQSVKTATRFLIEDYQPTPFLEHWKLDEISNLYGEEPRQFDIDPFKIRNEMYRARRFEEIAVVVADYAMPEINGLDFFKTIVHLPFKRILLTGEADEKIAVEAFNQGLIHRYIRKNDLHYLKHLNTAICEMEAQYFEDISESILARLSNNAQYSPYCLDDPNFVAFFNQFLAKQRFSEFYLTGSSGSFIFLDANGTPSWLAVKEETEMQFHEEIIAQTASDFVLNALAKRQYVPYFYHAKKDFPKEWDMFLYPAEIIKGTHTNYYIAYIDRPDTYPIMHAEKIVSYKNFLLGRVDNSPQILRSAACPRDPWMPRINRGTLAV